MLSCRELLSDLSEYLDDELSVQVRLELEAHLAHCPTCEVLVDSTRKTLKIVSATFSYELPEDVSGRILARIRTALEDR
jgi:anti-sigma factor RsiW